MLSETINIFEDPKSVDSEKEYLELMQELDLFLFREIKVKNPIVDGGKERRTNILEEAMHRGFSSMIDYIFNEGFSNVRAVLRKKNSLEIENEITHLTVSFFITHMKKRNLPFLKKLYYYLIQLM